MNLMRRIAEIMTTNLYLAYGSNLNMEQMRYRCPDAKVVGYTYLPDRKLVFRGTQLGGYLTLDDAPGARGIPCGVFEITDSNLIFLDWYEGYPRFYQRRILPVDYVWDVKTHQTMLKDVKAMIYLMRPGHSLGQPAESYWQTCMQGYADFDFDPRYLEQARKDSAPQ